MAKSNLPGLKEIQRTLAAAAFAPNKPGPLKIIADVQNPDYYEHRAMEMIKEANGLMSEPIRTDLSNEEAVQNSAAIRERYDKLMTQAMGLLALAKIARLK